MTFLLLENRNRSRFGNGVRVWIRVWSEAVRDQLTGSAESGLVDSYVKSVSNTCSIATYSLLMITSPQMSIHFNKLPSAVSFFNSNTLKGKNGEISKDVGYFRWMSFNSCTNNALLKLHEVNTMFNVSHSFQQVTYFRVPKGVCWHCCYWKMGSVNLEVTNVICIIIKMTNKYLVLRLKGAQQYYCPMFYLFPQSRFRCIYCKHSKLI